jgi:dipeptidyl-peptidase-4
MRKLLLSLAFLTLCVQAHSGPLAAQEPYSPASVSGEEYARAQGFLSATMGPLVFGTSVRPNWLSDGRFWYQNVTPEGSEIIMVDPGRRSRERAFDHDRIAGVLSAESGSLVMPLELPFGGFEEGSGEQIARFEMGDSRFICGLEAYTCRKETVLMPARVEPMSPMRLRAATEVLSPDGSKSAFIRDHNLWVRHTENGEETQVTTDGIEDFGYATNNAGWTKSDRPVLLWSPDSKKIATFQHDGRGVGMMYLVSTVVGHPELEAWKYPLPEDSVIFRIHRVVAHVDGPGTPRVVRMDMGPDQHRSTICDHIYCNGAFSDVEWAPDGSQLAFVSSSRDHKEAVLRVTDPETGAVRNILAEREETYFESGEDMVNWHFFPEYDEVIWFSERTDWGHLYLYDLTTGELKHPITSGDWRVLQLRHIDREDRTLYFTGSGREAGDPYFEYFYSVDMDGGEVRLLTPDSANHQITLSPDGEHFIDSYSTPWIQGRRL